MTQTEVNYLLDNLDKNIGVSKKLLEKTYKLKPMGNYVAEKVDRYITESTVEQIEGKAEIKVMIANKRKVVAKCLSLMLLHGFFKVMLFHPIYWRYLHIRYSQQEMSAILPECFKVNNYGFFLTSLAYLQANSQMIQKIATENSITTLQELRSEEETT